MYVASWGEQQGLRVMPGYGAEPGMKGKWAQRRTNKWRGNNGKCARIAMALGNNKLVECLSGNVRTTRTRAAAAFCLLLCVSSSVTLRHNSRWEALRLAGIVLLHARYSTIALGI